LFPRNRRLPLDTGAFREDTFQRGWIGVRIARAAGCILLQSREDVPGEALPLTGRVVGEPREVLLKLGWLDVDRREAVEDLSRRGRNALEDRLCSLVVHGLECARVQSADHGVSERQDTHELQDASELIARGTLEGDE
jgi:hypothetical protein